MFDNELGILAAAGLVGVIAGEMGVIASGLRGRNICRVVIDVANAELGAAGLIDYRNSFVIALEVILTDDRP